MKEDRLSLAPMAQRSNFFVIAGHLGEEKVYCPHARISVEGR